MSIFLTPDVSEILWRNVAVSVAPGCSNELCWIFTHYLLLIHDVISGHCRFILKGSPRYTYLSCTPSDSMLPAYPNEEGISSVHWDVARTWWCEDIWTIMCWVKDWQRQFLLLVYHPAAWAPSFDLRQIIVLVWFWSIRWGLMQAVTMVRFPRPCELCPMGICSCGRYDQSSSRSCWGFLQRRIYRSQEPASILGNCNWQ